MYHTHKIKITNINDRADSRYAIYESDNTCCRCHTGATNLAFDAYFTLTSTFAFVYILDCCPVCAQLSIREYVVPIPSMSPTIDLRRYHCRKFPRQETNHKFSNDITTLSPRFVSIYHQSEMAEENDGGEICGMGYRKALEFLIKDFLLYGIPDTPENARERNKLSTMPLSQAIKSLNHSRLEILASRSAWIGNDETHYVRKQECYSISDMKAFILATVAYIECELCVKKAESISPVP